MNQAIDIQFLLEKSIILTSGSSQLRRINWNLKWNDGASTIGGKRLAVAITRTIIDRLNNDAMVMLHTEEECKELMNAN